MNQRFILITLAACVFMFAAIFALTAPRSMPRPAQTGAPAVMYADCDAVRAAGAAPLRADQPGYRAALDGNMNGIACETVGASTPPVVNAPPSPSSPAPEAAAPPPPPVIQTPVGPPADIDTSVEPRLPALT